MNPTKAEKLFSLMRQYGIAHFKNEQLEIKMGHIPGALIQPEDIVKPEPQVNMSATPSQAVPPVEMNIPHHVNEVHNLLKLSDNELVDKLFPDFSQMPVKSEGI